MRITPRVKPSAEGQISAGELLKVGRLDNLPTTA